jgi:hypothetical protein
MEQSITWFDADSEDDQNSPKQVDVMQAMEEEEGGDGGGEAEMPRGMAAVMRQQNAPGIVPGMRKMLSF